MIRKRILISNILMYAIIVLCCYFLQNVVICDPIAMDRAFTINEYIPMFIGLVALIIAFFYIEKKYNNLRTNIPLIIILGILFICNTIAVLCVPDTFSLLLTSEVDNSTVEATYHVLENSKLYYCLSGAIALFVAYLFLWSMPRKLRYKKQIDIVFYLALIIIAILMISSYIMEASKYIDFVKFIIEGGPEHNIYLYCVKSFFPTRTNYGLVLFIGLFVCLFLHQSSNKWWWYLVYSFIFVNIIFTMTKTAIICALILIALYLIARFFITYKLHKKRNLITLSVFAALFIVAASVVVLSFIIPEGIFATLKTKIIDIFIVGGARTIETRTWIWGNLFALLDRGHYVFGVGMNNILPITLQLNSFNLLPPDNAAPGPTNGFLLILGQNGIIGLIVFVGALIYLVYIMVKIFKTDKELVVLEASFMVALLFYMITEGHTPILASTTENLFLSLIVFVPVLTRYYANKCPLKQSEVIKEAEKINIIKEPIVKIDHSISKSLIIILAPFIATFIVIITFACSLTSFTNQNLVIVAFILLAAYFVVPFIIDLVCSLIKKSHKKFFNVVSYFKCVLLPSIVFIALAVVFTGFLFVVLNEHIETLTKEQFVASGVLLLFNLLLVYFSILLCVPYLRKNYLCLLPYILHTLNNGMIKVVAHYSKKETPPPRILLSDTDFNKKKVLLIIPEFFYYPKAIKGEMEKQGYYVVSFPDRPSENAITKALIRTNRHLLHNKVYEYIDNIIYQTSDITFDDVVIVLGQSFSVGMIEYLKRNMKGARFIYYLWDTIKNSPYSKRLAQPFDIKYSFEKNDVKNNPEFDIIHNFYIDEYSSLNKNEKPKYDYSYIGTAYPRKMMEIKIIKNELSKQYNNSFIHLYLPSPIMYYFFKITNKKYRRVSKSDISYKKVSKDFVVDSVAASKFVLDIPRDNQDGLPMRVFDAIASKTKLLTTNPLVKTYDFYDPVNIYLYEGGNIDFDSPFFKEEFKELDPKIKEEYSISTFVKNLLR